MPIHDRSSQRLYVEAPLAAGETVICTEDQAHYLRNVLRVQDGDTLDLFNGCDGEWQAAVVFTGKKTCSLRPDILLREQDHGPDIQLLFAPLKRARLDYMVQKAAELGASKLQPVLTQHTVPDRVNVKRMRANAIEAAEQCGILFVPEIASPARLDDVIADWPQDRRLIYCDEHADHANPITALSEIPVGAPLAVLIGPEGGFSSTERDRLRALPFVVPISLGPRVMRADTAATSALALANAVCGDWR